MLIRSAEAVLRRHFGLGGSSMRLFRVALGLFVLFDVCCRCCDTLAWYTGSEQSLLDPSDTPHGFILHRAWFYRGPWALQAAWMLAAAVAAAALAAGWRPEAAAPVLYILVAGYQGRSQHIHDGGDKLLRHLLMWSCFLPLEAAQRDDDDGGSKGSKAARRLHFSAATVGLTLQVAVLYWVTAARRASQWWPPELSAVYYMLSGSFAAAPLGNRIAAAAPGACSLFTALGQVTEFIAPALLIATPSESAARLVPIAMLVALQAGIGAMMWLVNFQICSVLCMLPFLPPATASWTIARCPDAICAAAAKASALLASALSAAFPPRRQAASGGSRQPLRGFKKAFAWFLVAYLVYHSLGDVGLVGKPDEGNVGEALRFNQGWNMFGSVSTSGHWWEVAGEPHGVDLLAWLRGAGWVALPMGGGGRPASIAGIYKNFRWERYFDQLPLQGRRRLESRLDRMGRWLCSQAPQPLKRVTFRNFQFAIRPPGSAAEGAGRYGEATLRIERRVSCPSPR